MNATTGLSISGVCERDIDLLLLEEFLSNQSFLDWFVRQVSDIEGSLHLKEARRSVTQSNGESDLEVSVEREDGSSLRLLVENKVNAGLQPQQAERYRARGESHLLQAKCIAFRTVIVAPGRYFGSGSDTLGFDVRLSYESLRDWFVPQIGTDIRFRYKVALLTAAIEKGQLGYQVIADDFVSIFWRRYWELANEIAPELQMRKPSLKPSGSTFITFGPQLPSGVTLMHKLCKGRVDLQFGGFGKRMNELQMIFSQHLKGGMTIERATGSAAIRLTVPVLDVAHDFESQLPAVREGVQMALRLLTWFRAHESCWRSFEAPLTTD